MNEILKLMEMVLDTWLGGVSSPDFHSEFLGRSYYHEHRSAQIIPTSLSDFPHS